MHGFAVVAYWEVRRTFRNKLLLVLAVALPFVLAFISLRIYEGSLKANYTVVAVIFAVSILSAAVRVIRDRVSGFAAGLKSTPVSSSVIAAGRILSWVIYAAIQIVLYIVLSNILG